jgi:hypothetical protein
VTPDQVLVFKLNLPLEGVLPTKLSIIWFTHEVAPTVPDVPDEPLLPEVPDEPEEPDVPELPDVPEEPDEPEVPLLPEEPLEPEAPPSTHISPNPVPAVAPVAVAKDTVNVYTLDDKLPDVTLYQAIAPL